jgi:hypothetical protein
VLENIIFYQCGFKFSLVKYSENTRWEYDRIPAPAVKSLHVPNFRYLNIRKNSDIDGLQHIE